MPLKSLQFAVNTTQTEMCLQRHLLSPRLYLGERITLSMVRDMMVAVSFSQICFSAWENVFFFFFPYASLLSF